MHGLGAVQVHPLVVLGAVDSDAVLAAIVVIRLALNPVSVGEGLPAGPDPAPLPVEIISSQPVGGQGSSSTVS